MYAIVTESIGYCSNEGTLEGALAQFNRGDTQMVAISEPTSVIVRRYNLNTGAPYLYQANQVYVNVRFSPKGRWSKCNLLTFGMDRNGTPE